VNSALNISITLICVSTVLNLYLCLYVFIKRHHYTSIAKVFILHSFLTALYCFGSVYVLMSTTIEEIKFWTTVLYAGMPLSATMGLLFIMKYLGINLSRKSSWLLLGIPIMTFLLVATNDFHHLHYRVLEIDPELGAPYVHQEMGFWYIVHGLYTFSSLFVAFLLVMFRWKETTATYRPQLLSLLFGQLIPMITSFLYLLGVTPPGIDPVPMVMWMTSLFYLWSISTSRMFTLMPIAKDIIFNSINDGAMVLDEDNRLIEFNKSSQQMFPGLSLTALGKPFLEVWQSLLHDSPPFSLEHGLSQQEFQVPTKAGTISTYQVRISKVQHASKSEGLLLIFTDFTELKRLQVKLEHYAYYDELTGIYNRRAFFQQCEDMLTSSNQHRSPFSIILMDIDYFKKVNDTYGHGVGDEILKHVANIITNELSNGELFARYGGEEFVLALKGYTEMEAEGLAERLRLIINESSLQIAEGDRLSVTLSLGVAGVESGKDETLHHILHRADQALYVAKDAGRNQVRVYTPSIVLLK